MDTPFETNVSPSHSTHIDNTKNRTEKRTSVDTLPGPKSTSTTKKRKIAQLSSMVTQLREITETTNSTAEENEFEVFGKLVGLQLKSLPLILALEAQEHIQVHLNRIRRQHLLNSIERTSESPYTDSPYSSNDNFEEQPPQATESFSVLSITPNDLIIAAMENANVESETSEQTQHSL